jgi:hypothetical protein
MFSKEIIEPQFQNCCVVRLGHTHLESSRKETEERWTGANSWVTGRKQSAELSQRGL